MKKITAENLSDVQIREALALLPQGHYTAQWYMDALGPDSASHPHRRKNARTQIASILNARSRVLCEDGDACPDAAFHLKV